MPKRTQSFQSWRQSKLADPLNAASYLNAAIEDSPEMFLKALRNVAQARQMSQVARDAGVTRESLYRATSEIGNPTLETFISVLRALHLKIVIEPQAHTSARRPAAPSSEATLARSGVTSNVYETAATQVQSYYRGPLVSPVVAETVVGGTPPSYMIESINQQREEYAS